MTKMDWEVVTNYIEAVGTSDTVFPFKKTQSYVKVINTGNTNLIYTIGSKTGTLTPGQNIAVSENINSFTLRSASGNQPFQVYAQEAGTEKDEPDSNLPSDVASQLSTITTSLAEKAKQTDLATQASRIDNLVANAGNTSGNSEIVDIRVGYDGNTDTTAGAGVRRQISKVRGELVDTKKELSGVYTCNHQYLNPNDFTSGTYWSNSSLTQASSGGYYTQKVENIPAGKYYFNYLSAPFTWFKNRSTGVVKRASTDYGLSDGAGNVTLDYDYDLYFTCAGMAANTRMWADFPVPAGLPGTFVYGAVNYKIIVDGKVNTITVGSSASAQFKTIASAIASITDASKTNSYDIYLEDGTYAEFDLTLPSYVNLIGKSGIRANVWIKGELPVTANDNDITVKSTINITGTNKFKDIKITARNLRYPVHSESSGAVTDWTQIVDNCYIEHFGNQDVIDYRIANSLDYSGVWQTYYAWGEGASSGAYAEFENSHFKAPNSKGRAWYVHEAVGMAKPYYHVLKNCILECGTTWGVQISESRASGQLNTVLLDGCQIKGGGVYVQGTYPVNVIVNNCGDVPFICESNMFDVTHFPQIVGKMDKLKYVGSYTLSGGELLVHDTNAGQVNVASSTTDKTLIIGYAVGTVDSNGYINVCKSKIYPGSTGYDGNLVGISDTTHKPVNYSSGTTIGVSLSSCIKLFY